MDNLVSFTSRPTLRLGDTGEAVRELQQILASIGYNPGVIDGNFGNQTNEAVIAFQRNRGLVADGIVGSLTWDKLLNAIIPPIVPTPLIGIVIDPGHGGTDPGAVYNDIIEKEYNLKISLYMAERLRNLGYEVELSRTTDETLSLEARTDRINSFFGAHQDVIVISNHLNSSENVNANGAEVIYALRNTPELANDVLDGIVRKGVTKRSVFQKPSVTNPSLDYYAVIRDTAPSRSIIVEYGFISNPNEANFIKENWQSLTNGAITGLLEFISDHHLIVSPPMVNTHTVVAGDTLWSLARKYNTTVDELMRLNNLTSTALTIGQRLIIRETATTIPTINYTVQQGDTLWGIARRFNTTVDELMRLNNLTSTALTIGQILLIPEPTPSALIPYIVQGDTLVSLASQFNTTVQEIITNNNLTSNILCVGQELLLPRR